MPTRAFLLEQGHTDLCFDDILLTPQYSELESRSDPDISVQLGHINLPLPIISSPMDSITGVDMVIEMAYAGGLGILTRFIDENLLKSMCEFHGLDVISESLLHVKLINDARINLDHLQKHSIEKIPNKLSIGCAIGIKNGVYDHSRAVLDAGCDIICLDIAHGDHKKMYNAIEEVIHLKDKYDFSLMAGNVCTPEAATRFAFAGVDIIKVGIGPGAACTTRRVTGFGAPQLSAVLRCSAVISEIAKNVRLVADGGLRTTGDMVKALWAGADACMIGYMLAGTSACPNIGGGKVYRGMSSRTVHRRDDVAAEGIDIGVGERGLTSDLLTDYKLGLKSGFAMGGAIDIDELRKVKYVRASTLTMRESEPLK